MPKFLIAISFFTALMGCATTSRLDTRIDKRLTPPLPVFLNKWKKTSIAELEKLSVGNKEENISWWKTYTLATAKKTNVPAESCEGFKSLSLIPEFPLHDLALLHAYEVCDQKQDLLPFPVSVAPWYRNLHVDIKIQEALKTEDLQDDFTAYIEKAKLESNKKKKEEYYLKALTFADKVDLPEDKVKAEEQLFKNSPRLLPNPSFPNLSSVAADFRFHRDFERALETYKKILSAKNTSSDDYFSALKNIRQTYKIAQNRNDYINATADLVNWAKSQFKKNKKDRKAMARYHDAQVLYAKTLWTEDQTSAAIKALNEAQRLLRGFYPMDEIYFIRGRIDEEKGNYKKALEFLEASYQEPVSLPELHDKILWLKSWNYYKLGDWKQAKISFEQMKNEVKDPSDKSRARFWLSRSLKQLGFFSEAEQELSYLIKEDPLGYYSVLAMRELNRSFPALRNNDSELEGLSLLSVKELSISSRLTTEWLIAVDEKIFAEKSLNGAVEELKKRNIANDETWLAISSGYARTGLYLPLFAAIGSLQPEIKNRLLNNHPDLLFPQAFGNIIAESAKKSGVPQEFIFSIIRQESAFNPEARSPVDAFGLMQLLPNIAKQLATQNSLQYTEAQDLFKPEVNIPLGAYGLKTLMKKYNNQFILAVSGYNANDGAIKGWLSTRFREDPVEFIEEVPYEETRTYIKLVLRNYVFYQRLLNQNQEIAFPEALLSLSRNTNASQ